MSRSERRTLALAPLAIVVGAVLLASVLIVRTALLDTGLYLNALDETRAYDRTYTQILADPDLAARKEALLQQWVPELRTGAGDVRAVYTGALRMAMPPERLRAATAVTLARTLAYLRGDTPRLPAPLNPGDLVDRVDPATVREVRLLLADLADAVALGLDLYHQQVLDAADELAAGLIPMVVPIVGGATFDPGPVIEVILDVIFDLLGDRIPESTRSSVRAALVDEEKRAAQLTVGLDLLAGQARRLAAELRDDTVATYDLGLVRLASAGTGAPVPRQGLATADRVVGDLNQARDVAAWFSWPMAVTGLALVAGGLAALSRPGADRRRRARPALIVSLLSAAMVIAAGGTVLGEVAARAVGPTDGSGATIASMPIGVRLVLDDVARAVGDELGRRTARLAMVPALMACLLMAFDAVSRAADRAASRRRRLATGGPRPLPAPVALALPLLLLAGSTPGIADVGQRSPACNGHRELCDRPYDEVVQAATHNSMASPDVMRLWPDQDLGLRDQLDAGVRALLLDTHYWGPLLGQEQLARLDPVGSGRLLALGERRDGTYLCHVHCAFGSLPLVDGLGTVRAFLDDSPDEVVTLIIQDGISAPDTARAFTGAGLDPYLHVQEPGAPWPTLGEMIGSGRRLVVFAEFHGGEGPPWYLPAFSYFQDTPFMVRDPSRFTCAPNRGPADAPLFLLNHWVQRAAPDRTDAVRVNQRDVIVERARRCGEERGQRANVIAVNFADLGELMAAVDILNLEP